MTALGSDQRKTFLQIETHLVAENRQRAGAGAIVFGVPSFSTFPLTPDTASFLFTCL